RDLRIYPKVVGGMNEQSTNAAVAFYRSVLDAEIITMASTDEAEFVKLIETTYRDVNIALANEYARFADAHGLDVAAAIAAANTQPYSHPRRRCRWSLYPCLSLFSHQWLARERNAAASLPAGSPAVAARRAPRQ